MLLSGHRVVPRMERLRVTVSTMRELRSVRVWEKLSNEKVMLITWVKIGSRGQVIYSLQNGGLGKT